ncbi:Peptidase M15A [Desulfotomaculum nigrificans CO-1-SRB]|uniref:Murein endopeptidase K n=2 Tax=Eubacteriales TaxID=186802 RepID=F6B762_DESCC|nr:MULTISPECIES: D-Ala-D-Ala carboxypeptidase family metallohydrolase [Eubacteriales]AEF94487.1 Peptidase M15A [Desulfotomaculum nigrificans CO-1-SRB]AQS59640.1 peptidase M15 [Desulforamulus ferrireducens]SHH44523.1 Peptidase M15 [Desulforamulus hydrothermalis Lam5 = DSM 18033]
MEQAKKAKPEQRITPHFTEGELACRCCGRLLVQSELVHKLETLRQLVKKPVLVNSGYRCPAHNRAVGGAVNSYHLKGMAADIHVPGLAVVELSRLAEQAGFNGIGTYPKQSFLHVDVRGNRARWQESF